MVVNPGKFQIMFLGPNIDNNKITLIIEKKRVKSRSEVKILGIKIDDKLSFFTYTENVCSKQVTFANFSKNTQIFII